MKDIYLRVISIKLSSEVYDTQLARLSSYNIKIILSNLFFYGLFHYMFKLNMYKKTSCFDVVLNPTMR